MRLLRRASRPLERQHAIPIVAVQPRVQRETQDSTAEEDFAAICKKRDFPVPPAAQYAVDLGGDRTVADWAYPHKRVLIFVDGTSSNLHGHPEQQRLDRLRRAKARALGWHVVEATAQGLKDLRSVAVYMEEIALYLRDG